MTQYTCQNAQRRSLVLSQGLLNGIDYLEVLDSEAPAGITPQTTLLVHLLQPNVLLTGTNVTIAGGVRASNVGVVWAYSATALPATVVTSAQQAYFAALPKPNQIIVVRTSGSGDFSTYTLSLVRSAGNNVSPAGFDPRLSSVEFSFKVECPSDFDCESTTACVQSPAVQLPIDYLAKDYTSFRQLMLDRMAITMPGWTERSPADLGVAIVETLAYAADRLSYFQDAIATEAYLGTARRRTSVRRHAVLLDYAMHDGCNARAWVFLGVGPVLGSVEVPAPTGAGGSGTLLLSQTNLLPGSVSATQVQSVLAGGSGLPFETMHGLIARSAHTLIRFYTWSDDACCLPSGSTAATLRNDGAEPLELAVGDALLFEEVISPVTGSSADADASHRCVVRLTSVAASVDPYNALQLVEITWASTDALPFSLCISASIEAQGGIIVPDLSIARGNMVLVDHGLTTAAEPLLPTTVPAAGTYRPTLQQPGMTFCVAYDDTTARQQSAMSQLVQDPRAALPSISLFGRDSLWQPVHNLLNSLPFDHSFVVETEDDGMATSDMVATLRFGDGELGALPESDLVAIYRVGSGVDGNVGAEAITNIALPGFSSVRNPLPAAGGTLPETSDQVRAYAPQAFRVQQRAVTTADYATLAESYPQVQKAQAVRRWTGSWHTMFVTVERQGQDVDDTFEDGLASYLDPFRLIGYDVEVQPPIFVPLDIAITIVVSPGYLLANVEAALYQTFSASLMPNGQPGFFYPGNFTFGQPVYLSQIISRAMLVPGVQWVNTQDTGARQTRFNRWGYAPAGELAAGEIDFAQLEIAQLSNDPSAPENGRIQFFMTGGV